MLLRKTPVILIALIVLAAIPHQAYAYIDPGAGSYMLQLLVAGAVSALFAVKVFWGKIVAYFKGQSDREEEK